MTIFFRLISRNETLSFESFWAVIEESTYLDERALLKQKVQWERWFERYSTFLTTEKMPVEQRSAKMKLVNPKYVLRNYMAQLAIDEAEKGNNNLVDELYELLLKPYDERPEMEKWFAKRPDWAMNKVGCSMLSCSS